MKLLDFFEKRMENLTVWDVALIKYSVFAFALLLAKLFPVLLEAPLWVYVSLAILLGAKPVYVFYFKK